MTQLISGLYDHIANLLDSMGDDPASVAATLRAEEIRGMRGSALAHPVCRWLTRLVPDLSAVLGAETVQAFRPGRGNCMQGVLVPLPAPVRAFADRFDDGQHPELELWLGPPAARHPRDSTSDTAQLPAVPA